MNKYKAKLYLSWIFSNSQSIRWRTQGKILSTISKKNRLKIKTALDVGCGGGFYAIHNHLKYKTPTTLCDYSAVLLQLAKEHVSSAGLISLASFEQCSAEKLPFQAETFDFIQCMEVLEHLLNPLKALQEFHRVAVPSASLVVSVPHPPEWIKNTGHIVEGYTEPEICALIEMAGWKIEETEYCLLFLSRIIIFINSILCIPLPVNFLIILENFVPRKIRRFFLPYNTVIYAKKFTNTKNISTPRYGIE